MEEIFVKLFSYLQMPFVRYAIIVGVLIALCSSLLGVNLVLNGSPLSATACRMSRSARSRWRLSRG